MRPEDNPADDVQPTKEEYEAWERQAREQAAGFAARHLAKSENGRDALRRVLDWLEASGLSLDGQNQEAILELQRLAWEGWAGTVRDAMHQALGD